jgi:hypothetical protein
VQGSGSRQESARGVCGGSPQNRRVTWLSHKTKTGGSASEDGIRAPRSFEVEDTRRDCKACVEAKRGAVAGHLSDSATTNIPRVPSGTCILVLCHRVVSSFSCLHINLEERGWQPSLETLVHLLLLFSLPIFPRFSITLA